MKKYISPEMVTVELRANRPVATSWDQFEEFEKFEDDPITNANQILTKEAVIGKDLWDEEW